ncbi:MAG: fibronectin type III domain-containing protein, partial [Actinobacteria bacterium]|nr:fibronectin type III domain-containing protein [Actinomycetota bacterium]
DQYGPHQVRQDAGVYPGGLWEYGAATTTTTTPSALVPGAPAGLAASLGPDGSSQIDLAWAQGAPASTAWEIHQSSDNGTTWTTLTTSQPGATTAFSVSGLAQSTTYTFRVRGLLGDQVSAWSTSASATTTSAGGVCASLSGSATPSPSDRLASKYLEDDVLVKVNTNGGCAYGLRLRFTPGSGSPPSTYTVSMLQVGSEFQYAIAKNAYKWTTGATTFEILDPSNHVITQIAFAVADAP